MLTICIRAMNISLQQDISFLLHTRAHFEQVTKQHIFHIRSFFPMDPYSSFLAVAISNPYKYVLTITMYPHFNAIFAKGQRAKLWILP